MPLPPLAALRPHIAPRSELKVRAVGHEAFEAAEILQLMLRLSLIAPDAFTADEALQLLGVDPEDDFETFELGWAVKRLARSESAH